MRIPTLLALALLLAPTAAAGAADAERQEHCPPWESGLDGIAGTIVDGAAWAVHGLCSVFVAGADAALMVTRLAVGWVAGLVQGLA